MANHKAAAKSHPWKRQINWPMVQNVDQDPNGAIFNHAAISFRDSMTKRYAAHLTRIADEKRAARQREIEARKA